MKCKVIGCVNHTDDGQFYGNICMPCYRHMLTFVELGNDYSQMYLNTKELYKEYLFQAEVEMLKNKWKLK